MEFEDFERVRQEQRKPLDQKIKKSMKALEDAFNESKRPCVAFSGGKASLVALHLSLEINPKVMVLFNNTTNEFPETLKYVRRLARNWNLNFYEVRPKTNYWKVVKKYGFPHQQRYKYGEPMCCSLLKTDPAYEFYRKKHVDCVITGIQASESGARLRIIADRGILYLTSMVGKRSLPWEVVKVHPVGYWKDNDIWEYIRENNLPVNPVYQKYKIDRSGCMACTGFFNWEEKLNRINPTLYRHVMRLMKRTTLSDFKSSDYEPFSDYPVQKTLETYF